MIITIASTPINLHVVGFFFKGTKFNTQDYVSAILQFFADWRLGEVGVINRKLIVYAGNARSHIAKM
jgi:hypothetical protein